MVKVSKEEFQGTLDFSPEQLKTEGLNLLKLGLYRLGVSVLFTIWEIDVPNNTPQHLGSLAMQMLV